MGGVGAGTPEAGGGAPPPTAVHEGGGGGGGGAGLPVMLGWFGFGERTILVAVNYTVLFPVIFNALLGVKSVPRIYVNALRTLGASRWRIVRDVLLPGALPNIATARRPRGGHGRG